MKKILNFIEPAYHLRNKNRLERHNVKTVRYVTETISHFGLKIWNLFLEQYKEIDSLSIFKLKISNWETDNFLANYAKHIYSIWVLFKCALIFP